MVESIVTEVEEKTECVEMVEYKSPEYYILKEIYIIPLNPIINPDNIEYHENIQFMLLRKDETITPYDLELNEIFNLLLKPFNIHGFINKIFNYFRQTYILYINYIVTKHKTEELYKQSSVNLLFDKNYTDKLLDRLLNIWEILQKLILKRIYEPFVILVGITYYIRIFLKWRKDLDDFPNFLTNQHYILCCFQLADKVFTDVNYRNVDVVRSFNENNYKYFNLVNMNCCEWSVCNLLQFNFSIDKDIIKTIFETIEKNN
jgi:hypothetical protein